MFFQAQGLLDIGHCSRGCFCDSFIINVPVLAEDISDDTMDSFCVEIWYIKSMQNIQNFYGANNVEIQSQFVCSST